MSARLFRYAARAADGTTVQGTVEATEIGEVADLLRARELFATAIDPVGEWTRNMLEMLPRARIDRTALLGFFRAFATLVRAGVPIGRALTITIERATDRRLREALASILAEIEGGSALSEAMARRSQDFSPLFVAMIAAGEAGGILDDVLERLARLLEREAALRKKLRAALAYPCVVLICAAALITLLIVKIVPMFAEIFTSFGVDLPFTARLLIGTAAALQSPLPWVVAPALIFAAALIFHRFAASEVGALIVDGARLRLPIFGRLIDRSITARTARMLATLLHSGIELVRAIEAVIPVSGSARYARALRTVGAGLRSGEPFSAPLAASGMFDPLVVALVRVGEETGLLDEMLFNVADYFEADVEATIATMSAVLEPLLIVILGSVVAGIVCSIFLPLYSLIGSISK